MPHCCSAFGCKNRRVKGCTLQFFSYPLKDDIRLKKWIHAVGRANFTPTRHSKLCSVHFELSAYENRPGINVPYLKKTAVPTIFAHWQNPELKNRRTRKRNINDPLIEFVSVSEEQTFDRQENPEETWQSKRIGSSLSHTEKETAVTSIFENHTARLQEPEPKNPIIRKCSISEPSIDFVSVSKEQTFDRHENPEETCQPKRIGSSSFHTEKETAVPSIFINESAHLQQAEPKNPRTRECNKSEPSLEFILVSEERRFVHHENLEETYQPEKIKRINTDLLLRKIKTLNQKLRRKERQISNLKDLVKQLQKKTACERSSDFEV